ncbi:hypothetical protein ACQP3F_33615, partial [Escherichia coli]
YACCPVTHLELHLQVSEKAPSQEINFVWLNSGLPEVSNLQMLPFEYVSSKTVLQLAVTFPKETNKVSLF